MRRQTNRILILLLFAAPLFAAGPMSVTAFAQSKEAVSKPQNKQTLEDSKQQLTDAQVQQLLLLMDTDKNGKISKQEWMNFMSAEFDRLDTNKTGELDPKELAHSKLQASTFAYAGK